MWNLRARWPRPSCRGRCTHFYHPTLRTIALYRYRTGRHTERSDCTHLTKFDVSQAHVVRATSQKWHGVRRLQAGWSRLVLRRLRWSAPASAVVRRAVAAGWSHQLGTALRHGTQTRRLHARLLVSRLDRRQYSTYVRKQHLHYYSLKLFIIRIIIFIHFYALWSVLYDFLL